LSVLFNNVALSFGGFNNLSCLGFVETSKCVVERALPVLHYCVASSADMLALG